MDTTTAEQIKISRIVAASPADVFDAFTNHEALSSWFAPNYELIPDVDCVPVVGGGYRAAMRHQNGNVHTAYGTFKKIEPHCVVFTWCWEDEAMATMGETLVTVDIEQVGEGTKVTLTHEGFPAQEIASKHREGWDGCMARLADTFAPSAVHHLATTLALHRRLYFNALRGVSTEDHRRRINGRTNHLLWIAGHLAHSRSMIAQMLGQAIESPLAIFHDPINDEHPYADMEAIIAFFRTASEAVQKGLLAVKSEDLQMSHNFPHPIPINDQTLGGMLNFLVDHESYHIGQLGFLRKSLGYEAVSYAPATTIPPAFHGRILWYDLMTNDVDGAAGFYKSVAGWETEAWTGGDGASPPYTMWTNQGTPLGGVMTLPDEVPEGTPPHWVAFIGTQDVDATVSKAQELGGAVLRPAFDVPSVGRIAFLADPLGAPFGVFTPQENAPGHDNPSTVGEFSWHELMTTDYEQAFGFYSALFGWQAAGEMDMAEMNLGIYKMFGRRGLPLGGMFDKSDEMPSPPAWLLYIHVADIGSGIERVSTGGGQVLEEPMEVPGGDMVVPCVDPQGAHFALHAAQK